MVLARLRKFNLLSALLVLTLTCSLTFAVPKGRTSKPRKASARGAQKATKKSAKSAKSAKIAKNNSRGRAVKSQKRGRAGKSDRLSARKSKKGGRLSAREMKIARLRGRGRQGRWRRQVARSRPVYTGSRIHRYLTDQWTKSQDPAERALPREEESNESLQPAEVKPAEGNPAAAAVSSASTSPDATQLRAPDQTLSDLQQPVYTNPLVAAYAESLAVRGFDPEAQGFIIETMNGEVLAEHNADRQFNPASVVKVATSLAAISKLGPDFRFRTSIYTDGSLDTSTGVLNGSIYLIGSGDPAFFYENALMIADKLNRSGIREVSGSLYVLGLFYFNFSASREASAKSFRIALTPETWNAGVKSAYPRFLSMRAAEDRTNNGNKHPSAQPNVSGNWPVGAPSLKIAGETITDPAVDTSRLHPLAVHTSLSLVRVLKALNDFSNNWMAKVIGDLVGGPDAVKVFLKTEVGFKDEELSFATSSGLGSNFISPRGTVQILRKLISYLRSKNLGLEEMLPVAGVDAGTLEKRFKDAYRGSVVAKTGTLRSVSALAGVAYTRTRGPLLFVIYNRGGSTHSFRAAQDETIKKVITFYGGPAPVRYSPTPGPRISERGSEPAAQSPSQASPR